MRTKLHCVDCTPWHCAHGIRCIRKKFKRLVSFMRSTNVTKYEMTWATNKMRALETFIFSEWTGQKEKKLNKYEFAAAAQATVAKCQSVGLNEPRNKKIETENNSQCPLGERALNLVAMCGHNQTLFEMVLRTWGWHCERIADGRQRQRKRENRSLAICCCRTFFHSVFRSLLLWSLNEHKLFKRFVNGWWTREWRFVNGSSPTWMLFCSYYVVFEKEN